MKKLFPLALAAIAAVSLSSCVSTKKITYFQGSDSIYKEAQKIQQTYEMHLKPADQIIVKVTCDNPELLEVFSQDVTMGSRITTNMSYGSTGSMGNVYGYTLDNHGCVILPAIGKVCLADLTCEEAAAEVEKAIVAKNIIKNPEVTVRLLNARVTVLGAVKNPHVVSLTSERNTVLDILSQCSDISDQGLRQKITLYREDKGMRSRYDLDLTQADIFTSPAFYVQQNDLIYVQPNKSQNVRSSAFSTFLSVGGSIISAVSSVVAVIIAITKK